MDANLKEKKQWRMKNSSLTSQDSKKQEREGNLSAMRVDSAGMCADILDRNSGDDRLLQLVNRHQ